MEEEELRALAEAYDILQRAHREACLGPQLGWLTLIHAKNYIDSIIASYFKDSPPDRV